MKTWIDLMSRVAGEMLFQGGYVATPRTLAALSEKRGSYPLETVASPFEIYGERRRSGSWHADNRDPETATCAHDFSAD